MKKLLVVISLFVYYLYFHNNEVNMNFILAVLAHKERFCSACDKYVWLEE